MDKDMFPSSPGHEWLRDSLTLAQGQSSNEWPKAGLAMAQGLPPWTEGIQINFCHCCSREPTLALYDRQSLCLSHAMFLYTASTGYRSPMYTILVEYVYGIAL